MGILPIFQKEFTQALRQLFQRPEEGTHPRLFYKTGTIWTLKSDKNIRKKQKTNNYRLSFMNIGTKSLNQS